MELYQMMKDIVMEGLPLISNLSNASAVLNTMENINWAGFYLVQDGNLILGPFQGEVACTRIRKGKGVCGTCLERKESIIVPNVHEFPGHIACSSKSKSEIVVPIFKGEEVVALIDIDAPVYDRFNDEIREELEKISQFLSSLF